MTLNHVLPKLAATFLIASLVTPALAESRLAAAQACTEEPLRLERLACFDDVFATPLARYEQADPVPSFRTTERWRRAFAQAGDNDASGVIYRDTGAAAGQLVTVSAIGVQPPRPVLTLQCHTNITELTLMLPKPLDRERVQVALGEELADWRVRDEGLVISAGRGLPSIRTVLEVVGEADVRIAGGAPEIDGLLFDLSGFRDAIRPLRETCGW
ncbi:MAG: type VI secretion system-associated protein [Marinobacter sp. 34-60-7]|nr:MAG: type VI secretion system-associated protein [Marinobacter sp. 34-60-7]